MKRRSNLAQLNGKTIRINCPVLLKRDRENPYDVDAVGVYSKDGGDLQGWLYKKDNNRVHVLKKLETALSIAGEMRLVDGKPVVEFWL